MYDNAATNYAVVTSKGETLTRTGNPLTSELQQSPHALGNLVNLSYVGAGHGSFVFVPLKKGDTIHIIQGRYGLTYGGIFYRAK